MRRVAEATGHTTASAYAYDCASLHIRERCKEEVKAGRMSPGQAQDARHDAALKVQGAWSGGCKRPVEMGGAIFVVVALTPHGGVA